MGEESQRTLDSFYKGYGDIPPFGKGPDQGKIYNRGNQYIHDEFPLIDFINSCHVLEDEPQEEIEPEPEPEPEIPPQVQKSEPSLDLPLNPETLPQRLRNAKSAEKDASAASAKEEEEEESVEVEVALKDDRGNLDNLEQTNSSMVKVALGVFGVVLAFIVCTQWKKTLQVSTEKSS